MILVKDVYELIDKNINHIESLEAIHPDLYLALKKTHFILNDDIDEQEQAIKFRGYGESYSRL